MTTHVMKLKIETDIVMLKDDDGYYAYIPSFKGFHIDGKTKKETLKNAKDAIVAYIVSLLKHNEPIPCCQIVDEDMFPDETDTKRHIYKEKISIPTKFLQTA